jgi:HPt (histidine-containing phosphotransfer) domain-containing protein
MTNDGQAATPHPESAVKGVCTPDDAIRRLAGCRDLYAETVASFFREAGSFVKQMSGAIADGNTTALRKSAHSLKGFAGMCGAVSVAEAAAAIEQCEETSTADERTDLLARLEGEVAVARSSLSSFATQYDASRMTGG